MKTIGLIGVIPTMTLKYYSELNDIANENLGVNSSMDTLISSVNLNDFLTLNNLPVKKDLINLLSENAKMLERGGSKFLAIAANYPHAFYDEIAKSVNLPVLHIIDGVKQVLQEKSLKKVALISTRGTLQSQFYQKMLLKHGVEVLTPDNNDDIDFIDDTILNQLLYRIHNVDSRKRIIKIIESLVVSKGVEAVILGSSELTHFIRGEHLKIPVIDSTLIHIKNIFEEAIKK